MIVKDFENTNEDYFRSRLFRYLSSLYLDKETYLITKIRLYDELRRLKSKHFNEHDYDKLIQLYLEETWC